MENSHEDVFYEVWFSKVASLQCTDCKSIKTDFATGFCRIFYENYLSLKEYFEEKVYGLPVF